MKFYDKILKACAGLKIIPTHYSIYVSIGEQKLFLFSGNSLEKTYPVSTSRKAPSCIKDSLGTPTGLHMIDGKIGGGEPLATVFRGRKPDGLLSEQSPEELRKNLITARKMRLRGLEDGVNSGGSVDTYERYVYIHGTNQEDKIGTPNSHGCVLMKNKDVSELFDVVSDKTIVLISLD